MPWRCQATDLLLPCRTARQPLSEYGNDGSVVVPEPLAKLDPKIIDAVFNEVKTSRHWVTHTSKRPCDLLMNRCKQPMPMSIRLHTPLLLVPRCWTAPPPSRGPTSRGRMQPSGWCRRWWCGPCSTRSSSRWV